MNNTFWVGMPLALTEEMFATSAKKLAVYLGVGF
jgi:hypothetical protein